MGIINLKGPASTQVLQTRLFERSLQVAAVSSNLP